MAGLRGGLAGLGVAPGDRVAIVSANNPTFVTAYLAALGVGAVAVPLNPLSPAPELQRELKEIDARVADITDGVEQGSLADARRFVANVEEQAAELTPPTTTTTAPTTTTTTAPVAPVPPPG